MSSSNYRPAVRNPDEISVSETSSVPDIVLPDAPTTRPTRKDEMSKPVLFYGKPSQVDDVITFCTVKFLADNTTDETQKAGYLASLFRGSALAWLTSYLATHTLDDYTELTEQIRAKFGLSHTALQGLYARQLAALRQKSSVQAFGLEFRELSEKVGLPDAAAQAQFIKGLKIHIQRTLVASDDYTDLNTLIDEATRIDSQLYNIGRQGNNGYQGKGHGKSRDRTGRFKKFKTEHE